MKKFLILFFILFILTGCNSNLKDADYEDIWYQEINTLDDETYTLWACIEFYDNGNYNLYDCDSEPTEYPFDNEWECKYKYHDNIMDFKCKIGKGGSIKILKWDEETFEFEYDGKKRTFKSFDWIDEHILEEE